MKGIFLDIETTGLDAMQHCAIDIAYQVINFGTGQREDSYQAIVRQSREAWSRSDPASLKVNGYTFEKVARGKEPPIIREEIIERFTAMKIERGKAVFICQNPSFDRGFFMQLIDVYTQERLNWPYHWLDLASMYWALLARETAHNNSPFPSELNLSKNEIAKNFNLPEEELPHRAMKGVEHLISCYQAIFGVQFSLEALPC